jgi:uroporphyrinogen-III decarboxylase
MERKWADLSWEEKREERFKKWLSPTIKFISPEAERNYKARLTRFIKAIKLEEPDRVPCWLAVEYFPAYYSGFTLKEVMYDYDKLRQAWLKFHQDFDSDSLTSAGSVFPGRVFDMIDYKLYKWPGHGFADDVLGCQYVEGEYMNRDEYDALIRDPADYLIRTFLPRSTGAFASFHKLGPLTSPFGIGHIAQFSDPDIRASVKKLLDAGQEVAKWMAVVAEIDTAARAAGFPPWVGGMAEAPYDMVGDTLRGTHGIMLDMFQLPDKLIEAMERLAPIIIANAVRAADASGCPVVGMPLHKGTGGFMSNKQFETFYWPTFKKVLMGLVNEGLVPMGVAEGNYEPRLEIIKDMPRSSMMWLFEHMDMAKAKKVLGDIACIAGNVPVTMLGSSTPRNVKEYCRQLIDTCAKGGGYILSGSAAIDKANPDNLHAMMAATNEYGVYKR